MENFNIHLVAAFQDPAVEDLLMKIVVKASKKTNDSINEMQKTLVRLHSALNARDDKIAQLQEENAMLSERLDDLEQYSRKPSRVYGIPESTNGSPDEKHLQLFSDVMCLSPPIQLEDFEVSHRVGKPSTPKLQTTEESPNAATNQEDDADIEGQGNSAPMEPPAPMRSITVRFASRRVKAAVMAAKKDLRSVGSKEGDHSKNFPFRVYISDDLTRNKFINWWFMTSCHLTWVWLFIRDTISMMALSPMHPCIWIIRFDN